MACQDQPSDVPAVILESFETDFPDAEDVQWEEQEGDVIWVASFPHPKGNMEAMYAISGALIYAKRQISDEREIPTRVMEEYNMAFNGFSIDEAHEISTPKGNLYELHVHMNAEYLILRYDQNMKMTIEYPETTENP
jgi:hypothetical protein